MNFLSKYVNADQRRKLMNYLKPGGYNAHPELKIKGTPNQRWKLLLTMRDLRLWIDQYAPFSSRHRKYLYEIYQINTEINHLQTRGK
jgi:hypothetical protein